MYQFQFLKPDQYLNLNDRRHWAVAHRIASNWKQTAWAYSVDALGSGKLVKFTERALVEFVFPVTRNGRRDGHNYAPTVKPIVDGMVQAGVFIDDNTKYVVCADPTFEKGELVTVTVRKLGL